MMFSCANSKNNVNVKQSGENVEFVEMRRLNSGINLKELSVIHSTTGIKELYGRLNEGFSRSAPIPVLENNNEFFLVLKPKLKNVQYGDIHIEKIEAKGPVLIVNYKEIENWEYAEKKLSNPVLIVKVLSKPGEIHLNLIK